MAKLSKPDLRATLRAIARGESPDTPAKRSAPIVNAEQVKAEQAAHRAWHLFVQSVRRNGGEPLAAPSATLTPLP